MSESHAQIIRTNECGFDGLSSDTRHAHSGSIIETGMAGKYFAWRLSRESIMNDGAINNRIVSEQIKQVLGRFFWIDINLL